MDIWYIMIYPYPDPQLQPNPPRTPQLPQKNRWPWISSCWKLKPVSIKATTTWHPTIERWGEGGQSPAITGRQHGLTWRHIQSFQLLPGIEKTHTLRSPLPWSHRRFGNRGDRLFGFAAMFGQVHLTGIFRYKKCRFPKKLNGEKKKVRI